MEDESRFYVGFYCGFRSTQPTVGSKTKIEKYLSCDLSRAVLLPSRTSGSASQKWKRFYDGCCELAEVFQMDGITSKTSIDNVSLIKTRCRASRRGEVFSPVGVRLPKPLCVNLVVFQI